MALPKHIGIIMDGNGRWATRQGLPRTAGHKAGVKTLEKILKYAQKRGVQVLTCYAFSSENWNRPEEEVSTLMNLFRSYFENDIDNLVKNGVRVSFIGDKTKFEKDIHYKMIEIEQQTANLTSFHVVFALSYGARDDIVRAVQSLAQDVKNNYLDINAIDAKCFASYLSTGNIPDPDFIIRTSGEERLSNFLLWESAYAELYFTPVLWPDFNEEEFEKALDVFDKRQRRFGKV